MLPSRGVVKADDKRLAGGWILDRGTDLKVELNKAVNSLENWLRTWNAVVSESQDGVQAIAGRCPANTGAYRMLRNWSK